MSTSKNINKICVIIALIAIIVTALFMNAEQFGIKPTSSVKEYETTLFDTSKVHTINIEMDDWQGFIDTCINEEYEVCSVEIDGQVLSNVAIRAKGNTSLTQVANYGNDRYSFKIEFDHYDSSINYNGLDKLCLNNIIQDNTYMKDYLTYQMMGYFGVDASLCSFVNITVNGENWGLYLAVEDVEESFLERNYGSDYGELYKPDSTGNMGGGGEKPADMQAQRGEMPEMPTNVQMGEMPEIPTNTPAEQGEIPEMPTNIQAEQGEMPEMPQNQMNRGGGRSMGSDDVSLIYTDDSYDSYSNIFDNAKTDITDSDKDRLIDALKQLNEGSNINEVVNIEEVIRYFVVHNFVCNFDSYTGSMIHNYYLYEKDGQMSMIPWDYNLAFGGFESNTDATSMVNYPIDTPVSGGDIESRPMLAWIFADETYTELYHSYFAQFISDYFDSGYFEQMIDDTKTLIAPYVEQDTTKFCTYEEFETGIETLKQFCLLRAESINGQLNGTIPSTTDGQRQQQASLIDASSISISDMGTMHGDNMGFGKGASFRGQNEQQTATNESSEVATQEQSGEAQNSQAQSENINRPQMMPNRFQAEVTNDINNNAYLVLGISCIVLFIGLMIAIFYKKKV